MLDIQIRLMLLVIIGICSVSATTTSVAHVSLCESLSLAARARGCTLVGAAQREARTQRSLGTFPDKTTACAAACEAGQYRSECPAGTVGCLPCNLADTPTPLHPPR